MPDRIAAGTLLAAAAVTGGSVRLRNVPVEEMLAVIAKLEEMGCVISRQQSALTLHGPERLTAFAQLQTQPHPGFPHGYAGPDDGGRLLWRREPPSWWRMFSRTASPMRAI